VLSNDIDGNKAYKLVQYMVDNNFGFDKIEDMLWTVKKYYDDRARLFKAMHQDLLYTFDRIDNQEVSLYDQSLFSMMSRSSKRQVTIRTMPTRIS
jgi:hypothetical protein